MNMNDCEYFLVLDYKKLMAPYRSNCYPKLIGLPQIVEANPYEEKYGTYMLKIDEVENVIGFNPANRTAKKVALNAKVAEGDPWFGTELSA